MVNHVYLAEYEFKAALKSPGVHGLPATSAPAKRAKRDQTAQICRAVQVFSAMMTALLRRWRLRQDMEPHCPRLMPRKVFRRKASRSAEAHAGSQPLCPCRQSDTQSKLLRHSVRVLQLQHSVGVRYRKSPRTARCKGRQVVIQACTPSTKESRHTGHSRRQHRELARALRGRRATISTIYLWATRKPDPLPCRPTTVSKTDRGNQMSCKP